MMLKITLSVLLWATSLPHIASFSTVYRPLSIYGVDQQSRNVPRPASWLAGVLPSRCKSRVTALPTDGASNLAVGTILAVSSVGGTFAECTRLGSQLTGALCTFCFSAALSNLGVLPSEHRLYALCWDWILPASLAVTVFGSGGRRGNECSGADVVDTSVRSRHGGVGLAFMIGALGSCLGSATAFALSRMARQLQRNGIGSQTVLQPVLAPFSLPQPLAAQCAAALCATYIGGSANLFVVAKATGLARDPATLGAMAAADVALMGVYFAALLSASTSKTIHDRFAGRRRRRCHAPAVISPTETASQVIAAAELKKPQFKTIRVAEIVSSVGGVLALTVLAGSVLKMSAILSKGLPNGSSTALLTIISSIVASSLSLLQQSSRHCAPLISSFLSTLRSRAAPRTAKFMMLLFFSAVGASAKVTTLMASSGPAVLGFTAVTLAVHCAAMFVGVETINTMSRILERHRAGSNSSSSSDHDSAPEAIPLVGLEEMLVASNANVGGAATAATFAGLIKRVDLVPAAAMWGTAGYAAATPIALALHAAMSGID